jgi:hypothetical protein
MHAINLTGVMKLPLRARERERDAFAVYQGPVTGLLDFKNLNQLGKAGNSKCRISRRADEDSPVRCELQRGWMIFSPRILNYPIFFTSDSSSTCLVWSRMLGGEGQGF